MLVVVEAAVLINGFAAPRSNAGKLLTLFEFAEAAKAIDEADYLKELPPSHRFNREARVVLAAAQKRYDRLAQQLPREVTDDWELATSEKLRWQVQWGVGKSPSLGLDAREIEDRVTALTARSVSLPEVKELRSKMNKAGECTWDVVEVALASGAPYAIVEQVFFTAASNQRRFARAAHDVTFDGITTTVMTLSHFNEHVLPFSLDLIQRRDAA